MPRKKKVDSQLAESRGPSNETDVKRSTRCRRSKQNNDKKEISTYFDKKGEITNPALEETRKVKKWKVSKDNKSYELPINEDENDSDEGLSAYFSPTQKKKIIGKERKPSLAAKIKANMSLEKDSDFEDNDLETVNSIKKCQNKNKIGGKRRNSAKNDNEASTIPHNEPSKAVKKKEELKKTKSVDQDTSTHGRKRKSNGNESEVVKKKKARSKNSTGNKLRGKKSYDESFVTENVANNKYESSLHAEKGVKATSNIDLVLKNETKLEEKSCVKDIIQSENSSDEEMMDVEEECTKVVEEGCNPAKPLPKAIDQTDALAILMHIEGVQPGCSTSEPSVSQTITDNAMEDSDDEEDEWEDVEDHHGSTPKKSQIPQGTIEVTFDAPEIYKKRKRGQFDLQAYFRRQINKFKREVAMDIHKVHLLCLLARCQFLNRQCEDETVQAQAMSITLVTKELKISQSIKHTENHLIKVLAWMKTNKQYLMEVMEQSLQAVTADIRIVMICVILLRQIGFLTRLMTSLQPLPFKATVAKAASSKKGKSLKNEKVKSTKTSKSLKKDDKASVKVKNDIKDKKPPTKKQSVKLELDTDEVNSDHRSKMRKGGNRKCSKVSKGAYKVDKDSDFENVSDDNDEDYKPDVDELEKKSKKRVRRSRSSEVKVEEEIPVKEEQMSDDDFDEESILKRTQKLRKESPSPKNRKILSDSEDQTRSGVDYWIEVYLKKEQRWISIDGKSVEVKKAYEIENTASQPVRYVVGITKDDFIKDVTARYASQWLTDTRKVRVDGEWWDNTLKPYLSTDKKLDEKENEGLNMHLQQRPLPTSIGAFKSHPLYALRRHLLKFEAIYPDTAIPVGYIRGEPVYARECVHTLHSRENWLKEGRAVRIGEEAYKFVKSRPKWNRPKEDPEAKDLEIFGHWQTEDYIPPPAVDGVVPRNAHGNVEMFQPSMLPAGTVHLKVPGLNKVAKKLDIDCAPAMVGWEHHCGFSHPLMDGWIVCEEHKDILLAAWDEEQEIIREKEQQKREKRVYENWRKLIRGMLIKERLKKRFDLEDKPKQKADQPTSGDNNNATTKEKADDVLQSWPQNRLTHENHSLCVVESM